MSQRKRYRVVPIPGGSDEDGHCHFNVIGPDVNYFARQHELATTMQRALNRPQLTTAERIAVGYALGNMLAGELDCSYAVYAAMKRAQEKLGMTHTYADLGPPVPIEAPDVPPLRIVRITRLGAPGPLGEVVIIVDAMTRQIVGQPTKWLVKLNPHNGVIISIAALLRPGTGFVVCDPESVPGNLIDITMTMVLDR